jgi:hypothetical protein
MRTSNIGAVPVVATTQTENKVLAEVAPTSCRINLTTISEKLYVEKGRGGESAKADGSPPYD